MLNDIKLRYHQGFQPFSRCGPQRNSKLGWRTPTAQDAPASTVRTPGSVRTCLPNDLNSTKYQFTCTTTGVNPAVDAGDTSPIFWLGDVNGNIPLQYYYVLSDIANQYWLPSVRSASSRFHSAIRRHEKGTNSLQSGRRTVGSQGSSPPQP